MSPREIMIEMPISQISEFENPLSASAIAADGLSLVTPVIATSVIAMMECAPIGMNLPMIAAIVPMNSASICQALGLTPSGTGITDQITRVIATATIAGTGMNDSTLIIAPNEAPSPTRPEDARGARLLMDHRTPGEHTRCPLTLLRENIFSRIKKTWRFNPECPPSLGPRPFYPAPFCPYPAARIHSAIDDAVGIRLDDT